MFRLSVPFRSLPLSDRGSYLTEFIKTWAGRGDINTKDFSVSEFYNPNMSHPSPTSNVFVQNMIEVDGDYITFGKKDSDSLSSLQHLRIKPGVL